MRVAIADDPPMFRYGVVAAGGAFPELTQRERAALEMLASGARNGQIAAALGTD